MNRKIKQYLTKNIKPSPELLKVQHLMNISTEDKNNLRNDIINSNEIRDPVKVYFNKKDECLILGGFNRWEIALELEFKYIPVEVYELSPAKRKDLVINDNLNRRHFTRDQKSQLIQYLLKIDPAQSNKSVARKTGTTKETVKKQRAKLEAGGEIRPLEKVKGADGKLYTKKIDSKQPREIKETDKSNSINAIDGELYKDDPEQRKKAIKKVERRLKEFITSFLDELTEEEKQKTKNVLLKSLKEESYSSIHEKAIMNLNRTEFNMLYILLTKVRRSLKRKGRSNTKSADVPFVYALQEVEDIKKLENKLSKIMTVLD